MINSMQLGAIRSRPFGLAHEAREGGLREAGRPGRVEEGEMDKIVLIRNHLKLWHSFSITSTEFTISIANSVYSFVVFS